MGLLTVCGNVVRIGNNTISAGPPDPEIYVTPTEILNVSYLGATCPANVCGSFNNPTVVADACTWLVTTSPVTPSNPPGTVNNIQICENITSSCRCGVVCYTPSLGGAVKCVTVCQSTGDTNIYVTPASQTGLDGNGAYVYEYVCGPTSNSTTFSTSCSWIHACTPVSPCASPGRQHLICIDTNTGAARCGTACYTPTCGTMRTITFCQLEAPVNIDMCVIDNTPPNGTEQWVYLAGCMCRSSNPVSGTYYVCFSWYLGIGNDIDPTSAYWCMYCNGGYVCGCSVYGTYFNCYGSFCKAFDYNDNVCIYLCAERDLYGGSAMSSIAMDSLTSNQSSPCFCLGTTCTQLQAYTC